jgi:predicted RNase H-like nuclease
MPKEMSVVRNSGALSSRRTSVQVRFPASYLSCVGGGGVAADDIADAFAALWTANRLFAGIAQRLPSHAIRDSHGLPMHIWY